VKQFSANNEHNGILVHTAICLPPEVTSAPSLTTFRTRLETFLFTESYTDIQLI